MLAKDSNWVCCDVVDGLLQSQTCASQVSDAVDRDVPPCSAARLDQSVPRPTEVRAPAAVLPASASSCQFPVEADRTLRYESHSENSLPFTRCQHR